MWGMCGFSLHLSCSLGTPQPRGDLEEATSVLTFPSLVFANRKLLLVSLWCFQTHL